MMVSVNIIERDIDVKTVKEKEYAFTEKINLTAKIVEDNDYVLMANVNVTVRIVKVAASVNIIE